MQQFSNQTNQQQKPDIQRENSSVLPLNQTDTRITKSPKKLGIPVKDDTVGK